jgi:hypothetical protein
MCFHQAQPRAQKVEAKVTVHGTARGDGVHGPGGLPVSQAAEPMRSAGPAAKPQPLVDGHLSGITRAVQQISRLGARLARAREITDRCG